MQKWFKITIDGQQYEAEEGSTVLEVIRANGIKIPTLRYHPALKPSGTCVNICPTDIIRQEDKEGIRTISIRDEIIGIHHLERCEACSSLFATQKFIEYVTRRATEKHPDVKEHHIYCPTCTKLFSDRTKSFARLKHI